MFDLLTYLPPPETTLIESLIKDIRNTSLLEFTAVVFGIASVWFAKKENIWVYPTGIVSVLIYVYLLVQPDVQLYADAGINFFYFTMSVYGWVQWTKKDSRKEMREISRSTSKDKLLSMAVFVISLISILLMLSRWTFDDLSYWASGLPYIDSFTSSIFIVAMLLMAFKKIEHWHFWIVGNIISIPLYAYKGLVFTSVQFTVFLVLAILGYIEWKQKYRLLQESK